MVRGVVRLLPNPQAVYNCLINIFTAILIPEGCLFHPQPENAPCHGHEGPTYHETIFILVLINSPIM